ncbi:MAG: 30S ribosomal protein S8 [Rhodospirillales bacterium]|nr:30S ribosomal protein S8 [Alphaproteobacteria bacterium]USO04314.1 MAG: 30S ribosomal protein S8 [Rhodospirillales bacterium]
MTMSDPLGDMLTRIRNGAQARKSVINCPWSKLRENVCRVLRDEGFIRGFKVVELEGSKKDLRIELKYDQGESAIREISRVSSPGQRVYSRIKDLPPYYNGLGISVVSTPHGVMADHKARSENVGGEVLCRVF